MKVLLHTFKSALYLSGKIDWKSLCSKLINYFRILSIQVSCV
jgi:hypothetical protein